MRTSSANSLSLRISVILSIGVIAILLIFSLAGFDIGFVQSSFIVLGFFGFSFFVLQQILYKFIHQKIQLLYRSISQVKGENKNETFDKNTDMLKKVDEDVMLWAEKSKKEIQEWKLMAQYRKEFVGNVSHELKTPIFNIQGYTLTLLEGGLEDDRINIKYLGKIEKNINRMISIVNDLGAISKLEHGQLDLRYTDFNIVDMINEVKESLEDRAADKTISFQMADYDDTSMTEVYADPEFIQQVISNLMLNSVNYGKHNGFVKVELFDMDDKVLIEISDNGIGIAEEDIARVFERFYRVDKSRSTKLGGTGLGLAIVKHIIEAHNQTLNIRSKIGIGTTMGFTLPKA